MTRRRTRGGECVHTAVGVTEEKARCRPGIASNSYLRARQLIQQHEPYPCTHVTVHDIVTSADSSTSLPSMTEESRPGAQQRVASLYAQRENKHLMGDMEQKPVDQ
ncbi:hypothetical protein BAUCODRAFT_452820 [Baudoinia panamericana UAMH 10762]|uniref:Uncharacterized protein n=1 Tax=Baudoinia panamericana (strain UAMH 10762) TaxID=717646 RepID=M2LSK3_BAUPA|nr:uncharacterized protein BAUCODRAFT_452820 [Baudoinia panamericana UAMH 10762]EMC97457.1 hypothetical protein BAUCODRAFT_452820 [Baudoinia panamericana UAMH 10762]